LFAEKNKECGGQSKKTSVAELTPIHRYTNTPPPTPHNKGNKKATKITKYVLPAVGLRKDFRNGSSECGFTMVNMPNRTNVDVRFCSFKGAHGPKRGGLCELFGQSDCS